MNQLSFVIKELSLKKLYICEKSIHELHNQNIGQQPTSNEYCNMLRALAKNYDFLQIKEEANKLPAEQEKELNRRHRYVKENHRLGKTWDEFEKSL